MIACDFPPSLFHWNEKHPGKLHKLRRQSGLFLWVEPCYFCSALHIRNFCIIAHIDHGKSTLADRLLEVTGTVEKRKMQAQFLDSLDLERERGITIKMAPVRMKYALGGKEYVLNLIDTPGHSDFSYEVSRALEAVEGAILLVDATQGIQAQTLANFHSAKNAGLHVIGAVNKVDLVKEADLGELIHEIALLIGAEPEAIHKISGKTGEGVDTLLKSVVGEIPAPTARTGGAKGVKGRALIFDSFYDSHKGVVASIRVFEGKIGSEDAVYLVATNVSAKMKELGTFAPKLTPGTSLSEGEIGYIATGLKDPGKVKIGDTILAPDATFSSAHARSAALPGYREPNPVIFVSFYPEESDDYETLVKSLEKLKLNDSALSIDPDQNEVLGRGFKVGFLGKLHFEIVAERLRREFDVEVMNTFPSVLYKVKLKTGDWTEIVKPEDLPTDYLEIQEPVISMEIITPTKYLPALIGIQQKFRMAVLNNETLGDRIRISAEMPLVELVSDFDDNLKSATEGYASFSYEVKGYERADVVRVDLLVSGELVPGLSRFFPRETLEREARKMVEKLKDLLPRQQFSQPVQASAGGRIVARADIPALRKELGNFGKNGGDRTRKMKLWKKQKRGKERLKERSEATISPSVFKELLKKE